MKITFVIGPSGVGKSTFIAQEYAEKEKYSIFNIANKAKRLFGSYSALEDEAKVLEAINQSAQEAFLDLMDKKELIVEYPAEGYDDGLFALCKKAKSLGIRTRIITLNWDMPEVLDRVDYPESEYFPTAKLKDETEMVLMDILDDIRFNLDFLRIAEVGGEGGSINFYRFKKEGEDRFFFTTNEEGFFDFKPVFAFEEKEGVNYLEDFGDFSSAFQSLLKKYPLFRLFPLEVHPEYKNEFQRAYQHFLEMGGEKENQSQWNIILN